MVIFPIIIVVSAVLYIYYKVAILKSNDELTQKYFNGKARLCLGTFLLFFGINQYLFYKTQLSLFIGILFLILGGLQAYRGFKEAKHYRNEWRRLNPNE
ncbi:YtpI family protein [Oceanobacillus massiliensis]|uniref:YtpI family protein n=1 Tax=Oceanobacillus massiliensis TaxID=1465765 RepID=UPI00028936D6|nr:YtpI family protein [Oceanobacillus massiliensis]